MSIAADAPAFHLPAALLQRDYALRPETEADTPFLIELFATTRAAELATAGWNEAQQRLFVAHQFSAQRHHYRNALEACGFHVIERAGVPVGRLYLQERLTRLHVVDILLAPGETGQGTGTMILRGLADAAWRRGKAVGIFVEKNNPALRLYRRLGFVEVGGSEVYLEMCWAPPVN